MARVGEEDLARAASVLVRTALGVGPGERFVAVGDVESRDLLAALDRAAREAGAEVAALRLDELRSVSTNHSGHRPHKVLPDAVRRAMLSAQASVFVASAPHAEASMREQLAHVVTACRIRHAHMPGITPSSFVVGLTVDHGQIAAWGSAVERRLELVREIECSSKDGTHLVIHPGGRRWVPRFGLVAAGECVLFPTGSLIVSPESVRGTFAATASLGEFFGEREGLLRSPVVFEIEDSRVTKVSSRDCPELVTNVERMLRVAPNSDRVGLVVLGINTGVTSPTGDVSVDQHRPGLHLVFGDPLSKLTAAGWTARTSFAACQAKCTVRVDGETLIDDGVILPEPSSSPQIH